ncbi:MAG: hypothetical protein E2O39_11325 [Planctomycetota bacterium]|nr:MAG: hypothetical protein E2O39_11325 [Planctomycetota bacterium]
MFRRLQGLGPLFALLRRLLPHAGRGARPALAFAVSLALAPPAPALQADPSEPGPWAVGIRTLLVSDPQGAFHDLLVEVIHPVAPQFAQSGHPLKSYDIGAPFGYPGYVVEAPLGLADIHVSNDGPFPTIVYSHGHLGSRLESLVTLELLASHGFIVCSIDHPGNTSADEWNGTTEAPTRREDISFLLDRLAVINATPGHPLRQAFDLERIGVMGWSMGGNAAAQILGGGGDGYVDERVQAIAVLAPFVPGLTAEGLAGIDVPALILGGTLDPTTPVVPNSQFLFDNLGGEPVYRIDLRRAGHASFMITDCLFLDELMELDAPPALIELFNSHECHGGNFAPIAITQAITSHYVVAFFLAHLAQASDVERFLTPCFARARIHGVEHFVRGGYPASLFVGHDAMSVLARPETFFLCAGSEHSGRPYRILGSFTGTAPGTFFGGALLPLNDDAYFQLTVQAPSESPILGAEGVLDATGSALARFGGNSPALAGLIGSTVHHAFVIFDGARGDVIEVSNPTPLALLP